MIRFLIRAGIFLLAAAVGILLTDWIFGAFDLETFNVVWSEPLGFVVAVLVFALAQAILSPFLAKAAQNNAPALVGAVGLLSTFVALILAVLLTDGLEVAGAAGWILGPVVVWLVGMLAAFLLPLVLLKKGVERVREND
ncbi:phage holin family protein [Isoptericola sp. NEAU-Y5]|uniref:Phage holin family protein n=1 Tax=Isoptericola luteus TaxID=2879484 RepID=A0ABS7Z9Q6_9MICO|nr:phage holin family protein [Isoptericola sp. NEAU-Y5]MCA5891779.1 phage holin family protein [Isoptericola sp. NEAU-Y5]